MGLTVSGEDVENARKERGWTQAELAQKLELSRSQVVRIEAALSVPTRQIPRLDKLFGGPSWRKPTGIAETREPYSPDNAALRQQVAHLTEIVEGLVKAVEEVQVEQKRSRGRVGSRGAKD